MTTARALPMGPVAVAALSGLFAGGVATLVTWAVENFGGLLGGVLGTLPTTIIPATLGIAISVNAGRGGDHSDANKELMQAGFAVPLSMLADVVFLLQWRIWPDRLGGGGVSFSCKLASMIAVSMGIWLLAGGCAFGVSELGATMGVGGTVAVGTIGLVIALGLGIWTTWDHHPAPKGANRVSWAVMLARGVFAGLAIFVSVLAGRTSSVLAGILAAFPAIFLTTMVAVWLAQGEAVTTGAVGPMMLGSSSVSVYAMLYSMLVGTAGKWGSMVLCWPLSVLVTSVPIVLYLRWREEVYEEYGPSGGTSGAGGHHVRLEEMEAEAFAVVGSGAAGRGSRGSSFGFGEHGAGQSAAGGAGSGIDAMRGAEAGEVLDR